MKVEYLLPTHIGGLLRAGKYTVKVLETKDKWFGVTYKEDKESVVQSFKKLIADGVYKEELYSDLRFAVWVMVRIVRAVSDRERR